MKTPQSRNSVLEWSLLLGLIVIAIVLSKLFGLNQRCSDALVYTVVVFTVVIQMLRPAWGRPALWRSLFLIFALHVIAILIFLEAMPRNWRGIPGLLMTIVGMTEGILVISTLWKKMGLSGRG
jgi:hypothetical protein